MKDTVEPIEATPAPLTEGQIISQLQTTVSASRLSLFHACRLKFFFKYVLKLKKEKTPSLHLGSAVHSALKAWSKARWKQTPLSLKELHDEFANAWADESEGKVTWDADNVEEDEKKTGWRLIETYIRETPVKVDEKPDAVEVKVEADLHQHGLPKLIGILDLVQAGRIIDFKTTGQTPNPEKVAHTNELQVTAYAVLYREATGKVESGIELHHLVKLKNPKLVVTALPPMSDEQQTKLFRLMGSYVHGLDVRDFVPSPGMQCSSCEFFNECRKWN